METPDQLHEMFQMQKAFNERIGVHTANMSEEEKIEWLSKHSRAVIQKIAKLTSRVPWNWSTRHQESGAQNAHAGVVDLFHLAISFAQALEMDANDVFAAYVKKNAVSFGQAQRDCFLKDERFKTQLRTENYR